MSDKELEEIAKMFDNMVYDEIINAANIDFPDDVYINREFKQIPTKLKAFYCELTKLCKDYNVYIGHEDGQGGFEISVCFDDNKEHELNEYANHWLMNASVYGDFGE